MQDQPPPLSPEEVASLSAVEYAHLGAPQTVKVFGIMHLIFGGLGAAATIWAIGISLFGNPMIKLMGNTPQAQMQVALQEKMQGVTIVSSVIMLIVTFLILHAGIALLKNRRNALTWSNRYAVASIIQKIINIILGLIYTAPLTKEMMAGTGAPPGVAVGIMETFAVASTIGGGIISCVYPALALILLNRPVVKTWFANRPA